MSTGKLSRQPANPAPAHDPSPTMGSQRQGQLLEGYGDRCFELFGSLAGAGIAVKALQCFGGAEQQRIISEGNSTAVNRCRLDLLEYCSLGGILPESFI